MHEGHAIEVAEAGLPRPVAEDDPAVPHRRGEPADRTPATHEPVVVREGRLGRSVFATRDIAIGETVLKGWGGQIPRRSPHTMQVDVDTHIVPDGVMVLVNHSCDPTCGVLIRPAQREIEVRALRPWFPYRGLTTTGPPMSSAAAQASAASVTGRPSGTGMPASASRVRVSSLSCAIDSATAPVRSVSAAMIRRCLAPWPSRTSEPELSRREGIPLRAAASTIERVLGPSCTSSR